VRHRSATSPREAIVTARIGKGDFADLERARSVGIYQALAKALGQTPAAVLATVEESGEQGRGGAGFPTGRKWRLAAESAGTMRYVIANGDEGDPGSFIDRLLLEHDPHAILEGMALCAWAIGASAGVVYIRSEYPAAQSRMRAAIEQARAAGLLGTGICGSSFDFDVQVVTGHGSYVCGEETALLNAIEGRRGEVRVRPPYPAAQGLYGQPTVVNNIETLVNIPWIIERGPAAFRRLGTADSPGTKAFCFNQGFARPGIVEAEFGLSLRELVETYGGGGTGWASACGHRAWWPDGQHRAARGVGRAAGLPGTGQARHPVGSRWSGRAASGYRLAGTDGALARIHGRRVMRQVRSVSPGFGAGAGACAAG
jgi:NADH-quinone oxidoreductase subunit F